MRKGETISTVLFKMKRDPVIFEQKKLTQSQPHFISISKIIQKGSIKYLKDLFQFGTQTLKKQIKNIFNVSESEIGVNKTAGGSMVFFPSINNYNRHTFQTEVNKKVYTFLKYMNNTVSSTTEYLSYLTEDYHKSESIFYFDTYSSCSSIIHYPKLFSWNGAQTFCKEYSGGHLPVFVDRSAEEEFVLVVKQFQNLFPIESVFVGLQKHFLGQVRPKKPRFFSLVKIGQVELKQTKSTKINFYSAFWFHFWQGTFLVHNFFC